MYIFSSFLLIFSALSSAMPSAFTGNAMQGKSKPHSSAIIDGIPYGIERFGAKYFVFAKHRTTVAREVSRLTKTDCAALENELERKRERFESCVVAPDSSACSLVRNAVILMSQEEHFQSPPLAFSAKRRWALSARGIPRSSDMLKQKIATLYDIPVEQIEIVEPERTKPMGPLSVKVHPTAMLNTVAAIAPMTQGFIEHPELKGAELVVNNRFFACDFEQGRVSVGASFIATINHDESYNPIILDSLWNLYTKLDELMHNDSYQSASVYLKAALFGERIAVALNNKRFDDLRITLPSIFTTWFTEGAGMLQIKSFSSVDEFKSALYPRRTFSKDVEISWSIP